MKSIWTNTFVLTLSSLLNLVTANDVVTLQSDIQNIALTEASVYIGAMNVIAKYTSELTQDAPWGLGGATRL